MKKVFRILCCFSYLLINAQKGEVEIINTSVNSKYDEFGVTYLNNNTVIFASSKKNSSDKNFSKKRRRTNQQGFLELYEAQILENGDIVQIKNYSNEEDNKFNESDISFAPDGKTIYFTWNNFYNTQSRKDSAKWRTHQIMKGTQLGTSEVFNVIQLPFTSKEYSTKSPEVSKDGKQLFFISDMPNGYGGYDIYVVDILEKDTYSEPRNLGENINTDKHEYFPFVGNDNTLYFSSYGHDIIGNLDIFKSEFKNGAYQKAENMGVPFNSEYDDISFVINSTNNSGFFASNRPENIGSLDIYAFKIKDEDCVQTIAGVVFNEKDNLHLSQAKVSLFSNNELVETQLSQTEGKFTFNVKCDTNYKIVVEKDGFLASEVELITDSKLNFSNNKNIVLIPVEECVQTITGFVFNEKDNTQLSQAKVSLFSNNELVETKIPQVDAKFTFNVKCDANYKIIVEKDGFITSEVTLKTDDKLNFSNEKDIVLTPVDCIQTIAGVIFNKKENKQLSQAKVSLFSNSELVETIITQVDAKFTFNVKCDHNYNIIVEKDGFITSEVTLKTDDKLNFTNDKNIVLTPVECIQTIAGVVFNEKENKQLPQAKVSLFSNSELVETIITQVDAKFTFNVKCDHNYNIIIEKDGFITSEVTLKTDDKLNFSSEKDIVLTPVECIQTITGVVFNEKDNTQLSQAKMSLFSNNELVETIITQVDAKFTFNVKCDANYKIVVEKDGFLNSEVDLKTDNNLNFSNNQNIVLTPVECVQTIAGVVFNEKDNTQLSQAKVSLFSNNELVETKITQIDAKFTFNAKCDSNYKIIVEKDEFITSEVALGTDNKLNFSNEKNIVLTPVECVQTFAGVVFSEKDKQLSQAKVSLFSNNELVETKITQVDAKFIFNVKCDTNYKIIVEKDEFITSEVALSTDNKLNFSNQKNIVLTPVECVQTIAGVVFSEKDNKQLSQAKVSLFSNNELVETKITQVDAKFIFNVKCDTNYKIIVEKDEFITSEVTLSTDDKLNFSNEKNIVLAPVECNSIITGKVLDSKTRKPLYNALVQVFKQGKLIKKLSLDSQATFNFKAACESEYTVIASLKSYIKNNVVFHKSIKNNETTTQNILLEPVEVFVTKYGKKMIETNAINFDLDSDEISTNAAIEINKVIGVLISHPNIKIEVGSHTDSRAPNNYNLTLTQRRANSTADYIISNGIDPSRIVAKGYGETKIINKCTNGIPCSNSDHELNRRTEFIIIEE